MKTDPIEVHLDSREWRKLSAALEHEIADSISKLKTIGYGSHSGESVDFERGVIALAENLLRRAQEGSRRPMPLDRDTQ